MYCVYTYADVWLCTVDTLDLTWLDCRGERERETGCYYYADDFGPAPARLSLSPCHSTLCQTSMHQHTSPRGLVVNAHLYARTQVFGIGDSIFYYYPKLQRRKVLAHAEGKEIQNQTGENGEIKSSALKWRKKKKNPKKNITRRAVATKQNWNRSGSCLVVCVFLGRNRIRNQPATVGALRQIEPDCSATAGISGQ